MSLLPCILDTTFLVDLQRRDEKARKKLEELIDQDISLIVPTIVLAEYLGRSSRPKADTNRILETAVVLQFTVEDAQAAGRIASELYREGIFPGWSDVFIAGVAKQRGNLPIVTRNPKHFPKSEVIAY